LSSFFIICGVAGALMVLSAYWLLEGEKLSLTHPLFYGANALGCALVVVSLLCDFDPTKLGGIGNEAAWALISLKGLFKVVRKSRAEADRKSRVAADCLELVS